MKDELKKPNFSLSHLFRISFGLLKYSKGSRKIMAMVYRKLYKKNIFNNSPQGLSALY